MTLDSRPHALADDPSVQDPQAYLPMASEGVARQLADIDRAGTTDAATIQDRPIVVITMRGVRSGKLRRVPLMRVEHEGRYLAVASKGGHPTHPTWFHNITADGDVLVQDGTVTHPLRSRLLEEGPERQEWWDRAVAAFPPYAEYQQRAAHRTIPLFLLEPVD